MNSQSSSVKLHLIEEPVASSSSTDSMSEFLQTEDKTVMEKT